jgi:hypothetical protein
LNRLGIGTSGKADNSFFLFEDSRFSMAPDDPAPDEMCGEGSDSGQDETTPVQDSVTATNQGEYFVPPGFKLVPEDYMAVEPAMCQVMLEALKGNRMTSAQPPIHVQVTSPEPKPEEIHPVFRIRMLQQYRFGDIKYNMARGEEFEYCPEGKYIQIDGEKHTILRSFLQIWRSQFGPRPDPQARRSPVFEIVNPESCPPLSMSLGVTPSRPVGADATMARIRGEEQRGDATAQRAQRRPSDPMGYEYNPSAREHAPRGARYATAQQQPPQPSTIVQPPYPQQTMEQEVRRFQGPTMPPRGTIRGPDGLTERGRMIKKMSGDMIERPVPRQQTISPVFGGYEAPESVEDFATDPEVIAGGQMVAEVEGPPANEAEVVARQMDQMAYYQSAQTGRRGG